MASYYDFRTVLGINPDTDRACVGKKSRKHCDRCKNIIKVVDRNIASRLLNQMDRTKNFSSALDELEELASLMLCKGQHNCISKPHLSQVEEVRQLWTRLVEDEHELIRQKQKRRALAKAKGDLIKMRDAATSIEEELENGTAQPRERVRAIEAAIISTC